MTSTSRYKPIGWRGDSYRHYLARKGIATRFSNHQYFVRDELKGNRDARTSEQIAQGKSGLKGAYAKGWSKEDLLANKNLANAFGVDSSELVSSRKPSRVLPEAPAREQESIPEMSESASIEEVAPVLPPPPPIDVQELQEEPVPEEGDEQLIDLGEEVDLSRLYKSNLDGHWSPGVPPLVNTNFSGGPQ
jgi:hypothetical protein